jgi:biotin transport system substrate-specific component
MLHKGHTMQTALSQPNSSAIPAGFTQTVPGKITLSLAATLVVAAAAHVSVHLWFTPVPLTLQPLAVLGVGLALGPAVGFLTMLAYLAEGALGLPVFSPMAGTGGVAQLIGSTGGYLMAYPFVAFIAGAITRALQSKTARFVAATIGCTAAVVFLYACGAGWLMIFGHLTLRQGWIEGAAPFLPGEVVKILAAAGLYRALSRPART